jgi:hypothetical protein
MACDSIARCRRRFGSRRCLRDWCGSKSGDERLVDLVEYRLIPNLLPSAANKGFLGTNGDFRGRAAFIGQRDANYFATRADERAKCLV